MQINLQKSSVTIINLEEEVQRSFHELFPYKQFTLNDGIKYLGFRLKPNCYKKEDWNWLLAKLESIINNWCNRWLSRAGRLVPIKSILEAILVYWIALAWIPKSIMKKTKRICTTFLWSQKKYQKVLP